MQPHIEDTLKAKLQLNLKLAEKEMQPLIVTASKDKLTIQLKLTVKIYTKTSEVQGKLLNNEKYFTRNVVYQEGTVLQPDRARREHFIVKAHSGLPVFEHSDYEHIQNSTHDVLPPTPIPQPSLPITH
ncbi:hypothetical protein AVEN_273930-1 [Araneus ventricosus]|uniref:Uncharacterized protein n=1 Tax=Araneus ventricosus TaxID=182803 RepID=A0A4Y2I205_ARAVE|nr:hypothetical protein AVEN_273930-1 [Araneus ventricosus]